MIPKLLQWFSCRSTQKVVIKWEKSNEQWLDTFLERKKIDSTTKNSREHHLLDLTKREQYKVPLWTLKAVHF